MHRFCVVAYARFGPRDRCGIQRARYPRIDEARFAGRRASLLVPVLLPWGARPRRFRAEPLRAGQALVAPVVSPRWKFAEETYARTAASFDNPDFVDVVIHSYRHRYGLVPGDPSVQATERRLEAQPTIAVPTISIDGGGDGVRPPE